MQKVINYTSLELVELTDAYNVIEKNARVIILTWVLQWNLVYMDKEGTYSTIVSILTGL